MQTLLEFITSKKTRSVAPSALEPIALLFVQLSVDLRRGFTLKDGLYQFKKNIQNSPEGLPVLENVTSKLIELVEKKLNDASAAAEEEQEQQQQQQDDDDLDVAESAESILMSAVSSDQSKDRADRELVTPWLRLSWESFRLVLELLSSNSRLEVAYSSAVQKAYQFCVKYNRKYEFRRLCDLLRVQTLHAQNQQPYTYQPPQNHHHYHQQPYYNRSNDIIDFQSPETLQRYLDTRFAQLNYAVDLELWQEAFRTVEDIFHLISISKRLPKPTMMVNYYQKLAKIFLVSDNSLFHAAAWLRFYNLYSQSPNVTPEELSLYSSTFLLSTLSIQQDSSSNPNDESSKRSNEKLASLLKLNQIPTRDSLLQNATNKNVFDYVHPSIKKLYELLETNFHPLQIRKELNEIIPQIESNPSFAVYIKPLTQVLINRIFEQVSQVYETIKYEFLIQLSTFNGSFELSPLQIESLLLNAGKEGRLSFYIDDDAGVVTFKNELFPEDNTLLDNYKNNPTDLIRSKLTNLSNILNKSLKYIDPSYEQKKQSIRESLILNATNAIKKEREEYEKRQELLEQRKIQEEIEKKEREAAIIKQRQQRMEEEKAAEAARVEAENARRIKERIEREKAAIDQEAKQKLIDDIKAKGIIEIDEESIKDLDSDALRKMQIDQLEKDKAEVEERSQALFKKMDHTERAYRKAELPLLKKDADAQVEQDLKTYEEFKANRIAVAKKEYEVAVELRDRLQKVVPALNEYKSLIEKEFNEKRSKQIEESKAKFEAAKKERLDQIRKERYELKLEEYKIAVEKAKQEEEIRRKEEELRKSLAAKPLTFAQRKQMERDGVSFDSLDSAPNRAAVKVVTPATPPAEPVSKPAAPAPAPAPTAAEPKKLTFAERMRLKREGKA